MTGDFFELDLTDMDINGLTTKLNRIDNAVSKEVLPEVMKECGEELLKEEKRILSAKYPDSELIDLLTVMVEKTGRKTYRVKAGYSMGGTVSGQDITRICEDTALPSRHSLLY